MKTLLYFALLLSFFNLNAQHEEFFQTVDELEYKSNRSSAMMLFAEKHPTFKIATGGPQVLDSIYVIEGDHRKAVSFEILQFVSGEEKVLVQLAFLDDELYGKNISMLYGNEEMELAENKYDSLNIRLKESHRMKYFRNGGTVATVDKNIAAGKSTLYPIKRVDGDIIEATTGVIYNIEDHNNLSGMSANKGVWVFVTLYNTFDQPVNTHFNFPELISPYATIEELLTKSATAPKSYSTDEVDAEMEARKEKMEAEAAAEKAAAEAAEAEKNDKKLIKKKKKEKE